jgi:hypothetical protein
LRLGHVDRDPALGEQLRHALELDVDDPVEVLAAELVEHDRLVDPVQELGLEVRAQRLVDARRSSSRWPSPSDTMCWLPMFEVMIRTTLRKSTVRPWPSVSRRRRGSAGTR